MNPWVRLGASFALVVAAALLLKVLPPLLVLAMLIGGVAYANVRLRPSRPAGSTGAQAHVLGLEYAPTDPFGLVGLPLLLFSRGTEPAVDQVLWGRWRGMDVKAFRLSFAVPMPDGSADRRTLSCALAPAGSSARLVVEPAAFLIPFPSDAPPAVPDDRLGPGIVVRGDDPGVADALADPRVRAWLDAEREGFGFELGSAVAVAYRPARGQADAAEALEALKGFLDRVPPGLVRRPA